MKKENFVLDNKNYKDLKKYFINNSNAINEFYTHKGEKMVFDEINYNNILQEFTFKLIYTKNPKYYLIFEKSEKLQFNTCLTLNKNKC